MLKTPARPAHCAKYYDQPPRQVDADGTQHWASRAANFVIVTSQVKSGSVLSRDDNPDEYMLLLPAGMSARIEAGAETVDAAGDSLNIVPPGGSRVHLSSDGTVYRVFSKFATDMLALADNHEAYADVTDVAELESWPEPVGGYKVRHYLLAQYTRAEHPLRLFRSRNLMVNVFVAYPRARDTTRLSPHSHDDFEQGSLILGGAYMHHVRYPWTPDLNTWRDDEHIEIGGPSVLIIPPHVIHTTRATDSSGGILVDVFAPPRGDFSRKPGLVCNEADYPLPPALAALPPITGPLRG